MGYPCRRPTASSYRRPPEVPPQVPRSWRDVPGGIRPGCLHRDPAPIAGRSPMFFMGSCPAEAGTSPVLYGTPARRASYKQPRPAGRRSWCFCRAEGPRRCSRGVSRRSCRRPRAVGGGDLPGLQRVDHMKALHLPLHSWRVSTQAKEGGAAMSHYRVGCDAHRRYSQFAVLDQDGPTPPADPGRSRARRHPGLPGKPAGGHSRRAGDRRQLVLDRRRDRSRRLPASPNPRRQGQGHDGQRQQDR